MTIQTSDKDSMSEKESIAVETVEQISRNVTVGSKEIYYEDDKNVISVIINAISVRINMPRGTVKALMACFAVLLVAASENTVTKCFLESYDATIGIAFDAIQYTSEAISIEKEEGKEYLQDSGYPEGYDPDDPVAMGEVDPYAAMEPDVDEIMKQEAMDAWAEYNQPEPDLSDRTLKP